MPTKIKELTFRQKRFLLADEANGWADARNSSVFSVRIAGGISKEIFNFAFDELSLEVENLRARIIRDEGLPKIEISETANEKINFIELAEDQLDQFINDEITKPVIATQHSFRGFLIKLAENDWVWLMVMHHIFTDQITLQLLFDRLNVLYCAQRDGEAAEPAPWKENAIAPAAATSDAAWDEALADMVPSEPAYGITTNDAGSRRVKLEFSAQDWQALISRASEACDVRRSARLELAVMLGAQALFLKKTTGQDVHVVGVPVHGRKARAARYVPELRIEVMPLKLDISNCENFKQLIEYVRGEMNAMLGRPQISLGNGGLFSSQVNLSLTVYTEFAGFSAPVDWVYQNCSDPEILFTLQGIDTQKSGNLDLHIDANITAFPDSDLGQWRFEQIENLFAQLARGAELNELDILSEDERRAMLGLSRALPKYKIEGTIPQHILGIARHSPTKIAITDGNQNLSYGALCYQVEQGRQYLKKRGVSAGDCVLMALPRSTQAVVSMLSIMACGACYVPVDPSYPASRVEAMAIDCNAKLLIGEGDRLAELNSTKYQSIAWGLSQLSDVVPLSVLASVWEQDQSARAYIIYTSGSTGTPKGVQISHGHVMRLMASMQPNFKFTSDDIFSVFHSLAFDFSVFELWGALLNGACAALMPVKIVRSAEAVRQFLLEQKVTVFSQTPSAFYQFDRVDKKLNANGELALRIVVFGGEALDERKLTNWFERYGDQKPHLVNMYGITETTVHVSEKWLSAQDAKKGGSNIGKPLPDLAIYLLDENQKPVPIGAPGEIYVAGEGVAIGYLNRDELNAERFLADPFRPNGRMYRSGDFAKRLEDGTYEYLGRGDAQVQLRGFRIELGEIESKLLAHSCVEEARVLVREDDAGVEKLVAYLVGKQTDLRAHSVENLPQYMVPAQFVWLDELPLTSNGKLDHKALPLTGPYNAETSDRQTSSDAIPRPDSYEQIELRLAAAWSKVLGTQNIGLNEGFFDCGGQSVQIYDLQGAIEAQGLGHVEILHLLEHVTIADQAKFLADISPYILEPNILEPEILEHEKDLQNSQPSAKAAPISHGQSAGEQCEIAVIGMAGRFPDADNVSQFWQNILDGKSAIRNIPADELDVLVDPEEAAQPNYVASRAILENIDCFDEKFFGMTPREAQFTDPQHRAYLELIWHTLEDSGTDPKRADFQVGIWGSVGYNRYWKQNIAAHSDKLEAFGHLSAHLGNEKDFAPMRAASKFGLQGPAFNINTACSSSLVAIANAVHGLRAGLCRMAIAGGVSIPLPMKAGYLYQSGGIGSADGVCRPFDAAANGTVFGGGGAFVALKKLEDARADGDQIHAVIRGCGMNNDGARKLSFAAPSVQGQAEAISLAHDMAGVIASDIGFVETHGTATPLGDPIEIEGLTKAFRQTSKENQFCRLGAVKANIGHMDSAAGVSGFIKAVHVVRDAQVPPLLHFQKPNSNIDIENTPFRINTQREEWVGDTPRIAGVSSFGLGGTNVHTVLSQTQSVLSDAPNRDEQIVLISAKTEAALGRLSQDYAAHFQNDSQSQLVDEAWTSQTGRQAFKFRKFVIGSSQDQISDRLVSSSKDHVFEGVAAQETAKSVFLFPGQGSQYLGMGRHLYNTEPFVSDIIDAAADYLLPKIGEDLRDFLNANEDDADAQAKLRNTRYTQPAIYAVSYALARYMQTLGVQPDYLVGHSIGEFVAATLAGVFKFEDGLDIIAERARLMAALPNGGMLSVRAPMASIQARLPEGLDIAASNGPALCVVAGDQDLLDKFALELTSDEIASSQLHTSHAFHSCMMEPMVGELESFISNVTLHAPKLQIMSTVTNEFLSAEEAQNPAYWARHARAMVNFAGAMSQLSEILPPHSALIELGPRATLCTLARQCGIDSKSTFVSVLGKHGSPQNEGEALLRAIGELWLCDLPINWQVIHGQKQRVKTCLPLYSFEKNRHWLEPKPKHLASSQPAQTPKMSQAASPIQAQQIQAQQIQAQQIQAPQTQNILASAAPPVIATALINEPQPIIQAQPDPVQEKESIMSLRLKKIISSISASIEAMSGIVIGEAEMDASFTDLGLDSLLLSQLGLFVKKEFDQEVSLKSLMGELSSVADLSAFLNEVVPEDAIEIDPSELPQALQAASAPQPSAAPIVQAPEQAPMQMVHAAPSDISSVERVISDQLGVMLKQLQTISGTPAFYQEAAHTGVSISPAPSVTPAFDEALSTANVASSAPAPALQTQLPDESVSQSGTSSKQAAAIEAPVQKPLAMARIDKTNRSGELSDDQHKFLNNFIEEYCAKTKTSKTLGQEARRILADARSVAGFSPATKEITYSIVVDQAKGAELRDLDGNKYLDFTAGFGSNIFGHQPDFIQDAILKQLNKGMEIGPQNVLAIETAKLICELTGMQRVAFATTGSEAVTGALRAARTVTARDKIMTFNGSYHGIFDEVIIRATPSGQPISAAPGIAQSACQNVVMAEYCTPEALQILEKEAPNLAAIVIEPVQSAALDMRPGDFLKKVREITQKHGVAMIMDEVVSGFRAHAGGAQAYFDVQADLATYGKVMGGGLPIAAIAGRGKWMDAFDGGAWQFGDDSRPESIVTFLAGTLVRHPLALASAHAALSKIKQEGPALHEDLNSKTAALAGRLSAFNQSKGVDISISSFASVFRVNLPTSQPLARLFYPMMRDHGVFIMEDRNFFVTTAQSQGDLDHFIEAYCQTISTLVANGFLQTHRIESASQAKVQLEQA